MNNPIIDPPVKVCGANFNHPLKKGDCAAITAEQFNWRRNSVVSLFDGISCGRLAFEKAGIAVSSYHAFEIDKYAISISRYNYPQIQQCGNVIGADFSQFSGADFLIGGSPCTFWSVAKNGREVDKNGMGWMLFMQFVKAVRSIKPKYFLYENVASMPKTIKAYISEELEVEPILINSALVSAQQRKRLYWTNIKEIPPPSDKRIMLNDIITPAIGEENALSTMTGRFCVQSAERYGAALRTREDKAGRFKRLEVRNDGKINALTTVLTDSIVCEPIRIGIIGNGGQGQRIYSVHGKTVSMSANGGGQGSNTGLYKVDLPDGDYCIRKLSPIEAERCQTLPDNYTAFGVSDTGKVVKVSDTQRYKCIGNGWTVDVISYILRHARL